MAGRASSAPNRAQPEPKSRSPADCPSCPARAACCDATEKQVAKWLAACRHDLDLGHGFHNTRQGRRFTIAPDVQVEVLDRLLQLNHERYAEEVRQGLHTRKKPKRAVTRRLGERP